MIAINSAAVPVFGNIFVPPIWATWEDQISYNNALSLFGIADLREVAVQYEKDDAGQEGQDPDPHSIAAGRVIVVEDAMGLRHLLSVIVAFIRDGCKDHNGKYLQKKGDMGLMQQEVGKRLCLRSNSCEVLKV